MSRPGTRTSLCLLVPLLAVGGVRDVVAQTSASCAPGSISVAPSRIAWPAPLDRRITLHAGDLSLQQALDRVADAGDVRLSYSRELLPRERRVCIDRTNVTVGDVLTALLAGTDLDPLVTGADQIVLRRRPAPVARPTPTPAESPRPVQELTPVVVTGIADAERTWGAGGSTSIIQGSEIAERNAHSVAELFDGTVPGVWAWQQPASAFLTRYGSRGASSFGASSPKTYIDGIEVANPLLTTMLDPEHIERVEFIRGPQGAALYGSDALGGVVNITTRHDGSTDGRIDLRLRSSGGVVESRYVGSPLFTQSHSLSLRGGSALRSFALSATGDEAGSYLPGAESRQITALATGRVIGAHANVGITARLASATAASPLSAMLSGTGEVVPATLDSIGHSALRQYTVGLSTQLFPEGNWRHTITAGLDGYRLSAPETGGAQMLLSGIDAASIEIPAGADRISLRTTSVVRLAESDRAATTLTLGAEHTRLRKLSDVWSGGTQAAYSDHEAPASAQISSASEMAERRSNTGVSGQVDFALDDKLFLTGGLRMERIAAGDAVPRIAALPMLGAGLVGHQGDVTFKLRGAYGKGIRAPRTATAMGFASGPRTMMAALLIPEEQRGTEAAVEVQFGRALSFQVTRFDQLASGLAQPVAPMSRSGRHGGMEGMQLQNVGEIMNRGWEVEQTLKLGALSLGSTLSIVDSRVRAVANAYQGDLRAGDRMLDVPALTAGMTVGYQLNKTSATIGLSHARDWVSYDMLALQNAEGSVSGAQLRDYWRSYDGVTRLRASVSRDLGLGLRLVLSGDNLLDVQRGAPDNATILPGRTTTLTLRAAF